MEELVKEWMKELTEQTHAFNTQASEIAKWELSLFENHDKILHLNEEVTKVESEQRQLDANLQMINAQQNELDQMLQEIEKGVEKTSNEIQELPADTERRKG